MNKDLLKVIAGLECCGNGMKCYMCPYAAEKLFRCVDVMMKDALEILKEVESDGLY